MPGGDFAGGREGRPPEGGFPPGGPGGGFANLASHYEIGGGLTAVFAVLALVVTVSLLFGLRGLSANAAPSVVRLDVPREVGAALLSGVVLTLVFGGLIQLVPARTIIPLCKPPSNGIGAERKTWRHAPA